MKQTVANCLSKEIPDILTVYDVQRILSIGRCKAYELVKSGDLRSFRIGKSIKIPKCYLLDYIANNVYNDVN